MAGGGGLILEGIAFGFGYGIRINEKGEQSIETLEYSSIRHLALDSIVLLKADYGQFLSSCKTASAKFSRDVLMSYQI